jgi:hypothetical protein
LHGQAAIHEGRFLELGWVRSSRSLRRRVANQIALAIFGNDPEWKGGWRRFKTSLGTQAALNQRTGKFRNVRRYLQEQLHSRAVQTGTVKGRPFLGAALEPCPSIVVKLPALRICAGLAAGVAAVRRGRITRGR